MARHERMPRSDYRGQPTSRAHDSPRNAAPVTTSEVVELDGTPWATGTTPPNQTYMVNRGGSLQPLQPVSYAMGLKQEPSSQTGASKKAPSIQGAGLLGYEPHDGVCCSVPAWINVPCYGGCGHDYPKLAAVRRKRRFRVPSGAPKT